MKFYGKLKTSRGAEPTKKKRRLNESLYDYFEHKLQKSALAAEATAAQLERFRIEKKLAKTAKTEEEKSCGCC